MAVASSRICDVAVIGAGVVGMAVADALARRGADVTVLEHLPRSGSGCSLSNAGLICPSHSYPFATSEDFLQAGRWVLRPGSPFAVRPQLQLVPWLARLLTSTRKSRFTRSANLLTDLARESLALHSALNESGLATGFTQSGLLDVYETGRAFERGVSRAARNTKLGLAPEILASSDIAQVEPELDRPVAGGILYPNEAYCDPAKVVNALGSSAVRNGARVWHGLRVKRVEVNGQFVRLWSEKESVRSRVAVIAAGVGSRDVAATTGARLPIEAGKGFSVDLSYGGSTSGLRRPLMLQERRVAVTPFEESVRFAGMMHLGRWDRRVDPRAVASLRRTAEDMFARARGAELVSSWSGLRPCTPDGVPLVGWLRSGRVAVATGHGMLGVTLAPITGEIVADLLDGTPCRFIGALNPKRFR